MVCWVLFNTLEASRVIHFDQYPFVFLNLAMSAEAAFTGPILLIAANAGAVRDHKQANRVEQLVTQNEQLEERNKSLVERLVNVEQLLEEHVRSSLELHTAELRDLKSLLQDVHSTLGCSVSPAAMAAATSSVAGAAAPDLASGDPAPDQPVAQLQRPTSGRSQRRERR